MANPNVNAGEAQPRCGGHHPQDPTMNVQVGTLVRYLHFVADQTYIRAVLTKAFGPSKETRPSTRRILLPLVTPSPQWPDGLEKIDPTRHGQLRVFLELMQFSHSVSELIVSQWGVSDALEACYDATGGTQVLSATIHIFLVFACRPHFESIVRWIRQKRASFQVALSGISNEQRVLIRCARSLTTSNTIIVST
jgi:hypothetical protein